MSARTPVQPPLPEPDGSDDERQEHAVLQGTLFAVDIPAGRGPRLRTWRSSALPSREQGALFGLEALGTDARGWASLAASTRTRRCEVCGRPLRSEASRAAGVGPGCAAKRGRAVTASRRLARVARRRRHLRALPAA